MKIFVKSATKMRKLWYKDPDLFNSLDYYFISITGYYDDLRYPFPGDRTNVLRLVFDDVTEDYLVTHPGELNAVFNAEQAKRIKTFVDTIPPDATLYVNCKAGQSRSGAVGLALTRYLKQDEAEFMKLNPQVVPNPDVFEVLAKVLKISCLL